MQKARSHGSQLSPRKQQEKRNEKQNPGFLQVFLALTLTAGLTTWLSLGLQNSMEGRSPENEAAERMRSLSSQSKMLVDSLTESMEALKFRTLAYADLRGAVRAGLPSSNPPDPILHWAEFSTRGGSAPALAQAVRNPDWLKGHSPQEISTYEKFYLDSLTRSIALAETAREMDQQGFALIRVKKDPSLADEWISLAVRRGSDAVVVSLADPDAVFRAFRTWATHQEGGRLRSYLIAGGGQVLAHSVPSYANTDFSGAPIYFRALEPMLQGERISGTGQYPSIDQSTVDAAYQKWGGFPLGVVVERVADPIHGIFSDSRSLRSVSTGAAALLLWILGCAALVSKSSRSRKSSEPQPEQGPQVSQVMQKPSFSDTGMLRLEEIPPEVAEAANRLAESRESARFAQAEAQLLETALLRELKGDPEILERRKIQIKRVAGETRIHAAAHPAEIGKELCDAVHELTGTPALYLTYSAGKRSVHLQSSAGIPTPPNFEALSVWLDAATLGMIAESGKKGQIRDLSRHPGLVRGIQAKWGTVFAEERQAWALTGELGGKPAFFGVLVTASGASRSAQGESVISPEVLSLLEAARASLCRSLLKSSGVAPRLPSHRPKNESAPRTQA